MVQKTRQDTRWLVGRHVDGITMILRKPEGHAAVAAALPHASRVELARKVRRLQEPAHGFQQSSADHCGHVFFAMSRGILAKGIGSAAGIASVTTTSRSDPNGAVTIAPMERPRLSRLPSNNHP